MGFSKSEFFDCRNEQEVVLMAGVPFLSLSALPFPCPPTFISTPVLQASRKGKTTQFKSKKSKAQGEKKQAKQTGATESECCATCQKEAPSGFVDDSVNWICCDSCASCNHMICLGLSGDHVCNTGNVQAVLNPGSDLSV